VTTEASAPVLVTGTAGFIGNHVALSLLSRGERVVGIDNLTPYYDVALKRARRDRLLSHAAYVDAEIDLADGPAVAALFARHRPDRVVHLAAQPGVRYSLEHPRAYTHSNIEGFLSILEECRRHHVRHLVYASTSSVYGANTAMPFSEHHVADHPLTIYAATKRANELMAHSYSHLFGIPMTGLRFFTVYGPWGRPDMAMFKFTRGIFTGEPIDVFRGGDMERDFTYVDDVVRGIVGVLDVIPVVDQSWSGEHPDPGTSGAAPWRIYNIGNARPVNLLRYIEVIESCVGKKANVNFLPMQSGDVPRTSADVSELKECGASSTGIVRTMVTEPTATPPPRG
jgi:UDP-glucuronate 4-epimerase